MHNKIIDHFKKGNYEKAEELALKAIQINNNDARVYRILGEIYLKQKKIKLSEKNFKKSIKLNPIKDYLLALGNFYISIREYKKCIKYFNSIIKKNKNFVMAYNNLSFCYFNIGSYKKSIEILKKGLKIENDNHYLMYNLANTYKNIDELDESLKFYNKAIKLNPSNKDYLFNKSLVLLKLRKYEEAWDLYDLRISIKNNNNEIYNIVKKNIFLEKNLPSKKINKNFVILPEQGIGDQLLFCTMYKNFIKDFPKSFIFIDSRLNKIFSRSFNFNNFLDFKNTNKIKELNNLDYKFIYAASLGKYYRKNKLEFSKPPEFKINKKTKIAINQRLKNYNGKKIVGFSWYSKSLSLTSKSLQLNDFTTFFENENCIFINLQYGNIANEIKKVSKKYKNVVNFDDFDIYNNFEALFALIDSLDLVITIDNLNAQIAGLLKKKTIVITPYNNEYILYSRSNLGKIDWYPNNEIFYLDINKENINDIIDKINKSYLL